MNQFPDNDDIEKAFPGMTPEKRGEIHDRSEEELNAEGLARMRAANIPPISGPHVDDYAPDGTAYDRAHAPLTEDDAKRVNDIANSLEEVCERRRRGLALRQSPPDERDVGYLKELAARIGTALGAVLIVVAIGLGGSSTAQAEYKTPAHRIVERAIAHNPKICDKIEWAVYLRGYHKAEMQFLREWKELGYQKRVDGRDVFAQLVEQCKEQ
jgi:hypothetical protein